MRRAIALTWLVLVVIALSVPLLLAIIHNPAMLATIAGIAFTLWSVNQVINGE